MIALGTANTSCLPADLPQHCCLRSSVIIIANVILTARTQLIAMMDFSSRGSLSCSQNKRFFLPFTHRLSHKIIEQAGQKQNKKHSHQKKNFSSTSHSPNIVDQ